MNHKSLGCSISNERQSFIGLSKQKENNTHNRVLFFDEIQGICIADDTLSQVFDLSSQTKQKLRSKQRSKHQNLR